MLVALIVALVLVQVMLCDGEMVAQAVVRGDVLMDGASSGVVKCQSLLRLEVARLQAGMLKMV